MRRIATAGLVLLAVAVFGLAGYVLVHKDPVPGGGGALADPVGSSTPALASPTPDVTGTGVAASGSPASGGSSRATGHVPVVAFLGDDWTAGTGASTPAKRFTTIVSRQLGVTEQNFGADGSGYAKHGPSSGPYSARLAALVATHPDVVVVSGGRNDRPDYLPTAATAARTLFRTLHRRLPGATIVAVAPWWGDSALPPELTALAHAIRSAVTAAGGTYLDGPDPIHGHPDFMADGADPDDRGYAAIATALADQLRPLLPRA